MFEPSCFVLITFSLHVPFQASCTWEIKLCVRWKGGVFFPDVRSPRQRDEEPFSSEKWYVVDVRYKWNL